MSAMFWVPNLDPSSLSVICMSFYYLQTLQHVSDSSPMHLIALKGVYMPQNLGIVMNLGEQTYKYSHTPSLWVSFTIISSCGSLACITCLSMTKKTRDKKISNIQLMYFYTCMLNSNKKFKNFCHLGLGKAIRAIIQICFSNSNPHVSCG